MDKNSEKTAIVLKKLKKLLARNRQLSKENEVLSQNNDMLINEIEHYKKLLEESKRNNNTPVNNSIKPKTFRHKISTVMSADIHGMHNLHVKSNPASLIDSIDDLYIKFREVTSSLKIEHIKTVGDQMMCVGGVPNKDLANSIQVLLAATELRYYLNNMQINHPVKEKLKIRAGLHTGNVLAVNNGNRNKRYNIKGDTVNLAARIKQICGDDQILISADTYELVKEFFECEYHGILPVKYKGEIKLYSVNGIKAEYSIQGKGIIPNKKMIVQMAMIRFTDLQEKVLDKMEKELPNDLYYHNIKHTVDVVTQVELIGLGESVDDDELLLLKTAALFHDTGHCVSYHNHEYHSTIIAREMLSDFGYTYQQIEDICKLILATRMPPSPKNKLEKIMCDADLDYLGRSDMISVSTNLYHEMRKRDMVSSIGEWNRLQMKFVSGHQYFTNTARSLREVNKQKQIERIKSLISEE